MSNTMAGLHSCNPVTIMCGNTEVEDCYCGALNAYLSVKEDDMYTFDAKSILKHRRTLCSMCTVGTLELYTMVTFEKRFNELLDAISAEEVINNAFWEMLHVLDQIILMVSAVKECKQLIVNSHAAISNVLSNAINYAKEKVTGDNTYKLVCKLQVMRFFINNKFLPQSTHADDVLFDFALSKLFNKDNPDMYVFEIVALYKNCDHFDITWQDLLMLYEMACTTEHNYFWIYTPYVARHYSILQSILLATVGDSIYNRWFSSVVSGMLDTLDAEKRAMIIQEALQEFRQSDIYPYDSDIIVRKYCNSGGTI